MLNGMLKWYLVLAVVNVACSGSVLVPGSKKGKHGQGAEAPQKNHQAPAAPQTQPLPNLPQNGPNNSDIPVEDAARSKGKNTSKKNMGNPRMILDMFLDAEKSTAGTKKLTREFIDKKTLQALETPELLWISKQLQPLDDSGAPKHWGRLAIEIALYPDNRARQSSRIATLVFESDPRRPFDIVYDPIAESDQYSDPSTSNKFGEFKNVPVIARVGDKKVTLIVSGKKVDDRGHWDIVLYTKQGRGIVTLPYAKN